MTITVTADQPPVISNSALAMVENCTLGTLGGDLTANFSDPNGDSLQTVRITALPQQGTLALSGQTVSAGQVITVGNLENLSYAPAAGYLGQDSFQWTACDGYLSPASSATVTITVEADQPPVLSDSVLPVIENCTSTFTAADFTANFSGAAAGVSLQAVQITTLPQQGTLDLSGQAVAAGDVIPAADLGNLTYQPAAGYTGSDSLQWNVSDGQLDALASATMTLAVAGAQPPVAADSSCSMIEDCTWTFTAADFTADFSDPNPGDSLQSIQIAALPQEGALSLAGQAVTAEQMIPLADLGNLTYRPDTNYTGQDDFQWTAYDGQLSSTQPATWTITVGQVEVRSGSTFVAGMTGNASDVPTGSVDLGQTSVGASAVETLMIANLGDSPLTLDASSLVLPPGFSVAGSFPSSIAAGGTVPLAVQMDTSTPGSFSGTVSFQTSDAGDSPVMFSLSGQVLGPKLEVYYGGNALPSDGSGSIDLGQVALGSGAEVEPGHRQYGHRPAFDRPELRVLAGGLQHRRRARRHGLPRRQHDAGGRDGHFGGGELQRHALVYRQRHHPEHILALPAGDRDGPGDQRAGRLDADRQQLVDQRRLRLHAGLVPGNQDLYDQQHGQRWRSRSTPTCWWCRTVSAWSRRLQPAWPRGRPQHW